MLQSFIEPPSVSLESPSIGSALGLPISATENKPISYLKAVFMIPHISLSFTLKNLGAFNHSSWDPNSALSPSLRLVQVPLAGGHLKEEQSPLWGLEDNRTIFSPLFHAIPPLISPSLF